MASTIVDNMPTTILALLVILSFGFVIKPFLSPLRSIPGPWLARWSRLWMLYRVWLGRFDRDLLELHQKYGPIVRYGPYHYSFNNPDAIKVIYGKGTEFDKSSWYESWNDPGRRSLFSEPSVKVHGQQRRKFQATFTMSSMVTYESFADTCIRILCQRLEEFAKGSGETDLTRWMLSYAGDSVSMITYSRRMGFLDTGKDVGDFFLTMESNAFYNTLVGIYAELHPWIWHVRAFLRRWKLMSGTPRMYINNFNSQLIVEKRQERASNEKVKSPDPETDETAPKDFLSKFLDFHDQDPERFTNWDINVGLLGNIVAGSDTTASGLTAMFYCLLKHPSALSKLRDELSSARDAGALSSPPTFKEAQSLPYLQAVLYEALRMYSPIGLPLQRVVPPTGYEICGHYFPAGTVVGAHIAAVSFNTSIFGKDADVFRPERWIDSDKDTLAAMHRYWAPFGLGSRTCIGKNISLLEMLKMVPEVLLKFDFDLTGGLEQEGVEMAFMNRWFVKPRAFPTRVHLRHTPEMAK